MSAMSPRERLSIMVRTDRGSMTVWAPSEVREALDAFRAEVRREVLGDDLNPSNLVLDAQSYRTLAATIESTMADPDRWDGDDAEVAILGRYVKWLAGGRSEVRAEVLREAADAADCLTREDASTPTTTMGAAWYDGLNAAVQMLYREADAAGKDTPAGGESTRDDAETCGRCRRPFDPADTRFDGRARYRETPFCRGCVDTCHDSTDPFHRCPVCTAGGEPRA